MSSRNPTEGDRSTALMQSLKRLLKAPFALTITDNARSIISVKVKSGAYIIRLHHMFLDADETVLTSLVAYLTGNTRRAGWLKPFIQENRIKIRKRPAAPRKRSVRIDPQGRYVSLRDAFNRLNTEYFDDRVRCAVTWGNRKRRPWAKRVRLGSYSPCSGVIRINPVLDRPDIPPSVIEHVLFHEMLHQQLGVRICNGRRFCHHEAFRQKEKTYARREEALAWMNENFSRIMAGRHPAGGRSGLNRALTFPEASNILISLDPQ